MEQLPGYIRSVPETRNITIMDKTFSFLQFVFKVCSLAFLWHQVINMGDMAYKGRPPARSGAPLEYFNNSMKIPQGEVVWCSGPNGSDSKRTDRFCNFRNLCYSNVYERFFLNRGDLTFTNEAVERASRRISLTAVIGANMRFRYVHFPQHDVEIEQHIYRHYQKGKYFMISYGVLFTRKRTRQILNQNELASSIEKEFEISIQVVGMEDNSIMEIIRIVSCAELLISMHGALMILAMFLPRHAVVVEMYPYAINPEFYQVYQTMLNLEELNIKYIAWRNMNASNAIEPPSYRFHLNNLSEEKRLAILSRTEAPRKVCCYDPEWQYRMYQNTVVNVTEVIKLLKKHCI
ncbi:uncharacterized protein [Apostichopus japonicus]|uniref:uncharacterized protein n=1 Tax=Stichopus japonicus TaxID=307972 RepID=UPI003AB82B45